MLLHSIPCQIDMLDQLAILSAATVAAGLWLYRKHVADWFRPIEFDPILDCHYRWSSVHSRYVKVSHRKEV